jgi:hypothetical protein
MSTQKAWSESKLNSNVHSKTKVHYSSENERLNDLIKNYKTHEYAKIKNDDKIYKMKKDTMKNNDSNNKIKLKYLLAGNHYNDFLLEDI